MAAPNELHDDRKPVGAEVGPDGSRAIARKVDRLSQIPADERIDRFAGDDAGADGVSVDRILRRVTGEWRAHEEVVAVERALDGFVRFRSGRTGRDRSWSIFHNS